MSVNDVIMDALVENKVDFVTTVPCKQLAGVIEKIDEAPIYITYQQIVRTRVWAYVPVPI